MSVPNLPASAWDEIREIAARGGEGDSYVVTGSLVEGIGNPNSDYDLYAISELGQGRQAVSIGIRPTNYIDCEFMSLASIGRLREQVATRDRSVPVALGMPEIDRYYRLAICLPVRVAPAVDEVLAGFDKSTACRTLSDYAGMRAYEHVCRAACALTQDGSSRHADLLLRECALWHATDVLALAGEGYPSLKWTGEKAARLHGRGSREFHDLVDGYLRPVDEPKARLERLAAELPAPDRIAAALEARTCGLAERVRFLEAGADGYLKRPDNVITGVRGLAAAVCRLMADGEPWAEATAQVAAEHGVAAEQVRIALWHDLEPARLHGFLVQC